MVGASDYLALHARLQPAAPAISDLTSGRSWTYQAADRIVWQFSGSLRNRGIGAGDRVAALAKNRAELIFLHLACARIGALYVPLNWRLSGAEIAGIIENADPRLLLIDPAWAGIRPDCVSLDEFAAAAERLDAPACEPIDRSRPSLILYTSGTSGRPKGVLLSESNLWQTALNFSILGRVTRESAMLCDSPMFHIIGLVTNVRPILMHGGRIVVSDGFVPSRTLARLSDARLGITHYFCVPQMAALLRADPEFEPRKLQRLTAIFSGGGPHAADAIRAWTRDGIAMADGFGMSEAGTVSCMPLDLCLINSHAGSAGLVPPGAQVRIIDERGKHCAAGEAGEILVKGEAVTAGYWRLPEETRAAFIDGWLRTGDIGRMDEQGFLWLVDRKKDMFISGGENVYPAEIEAALAAFPPVVECAVIGMPDARWGEVGHLVMVLAANTAVEPAEVAAYLETRLARYKIPKKFTVVDQLPRNGAGKILKTALRGMFAKDAAR